MKTEMMINVLQPEESRIAIVEDGVLELIGPGHNERYARARLRHHPGPLDLAKLRLVVPSL